jgi:hydrogenase maturation protease
MRIVVLGIGNILLSDEGIGVRVVEALEERYAMPPEIEVVDGGTAGTVLYEYIESVDHLIIVDACLMDLPPGSVGRLVGDEVPAFFQTKISPHQLGLSDLLAAATLTDRSPKNLILIGIEPESIDTGMELTPTCAKSLETALGQVIADLKAIGFEPQPKAA